MEKERHIFVPGLGHGKVKSAESEHLERNPILSPKKEEVKEKKKKVAKKMKHDSYSTAGIVNSLKAEYRKKGKPFPRGVSKEDL